MDAINTDRGREREGEPTPERFANAYQTPGGGLLLQDPVTGGWFTSADTVEVRP